MAKILIVITGASNSVGSPYSAGGDLTVNSNVKAWNGTEFVTATPGQAPFPAATPVRNNVAWNFCKKLQEMTGATVYFVLSGSPGTPISAWDQPNGPQWIALDTAVQGALASPEMSDIDHADCLIWYHGGADDENDHYRDDFMELRDSCINSGWLTETTPVLVGEIVDNNIAKSQTIELLNDPISHPWMGYASNAGIERLPGNQHPTGDGCVEAGRNRFYPAFLNIPRKTPQIYKQWTPVLCAPAMPDLAYVEHETYGGSYLVNGVVFVWFKLTLASLSGGSGALTITGLPYQPGLSIPAQGAHFQTGVPVEVSGVNLTGEETLVMRTYGAFGIKLMRSTVNGTAALTVAKITGSFTLAGSLTYFID